MPRVSRYKIDKLLEKEIVDQFWNFIGTVNNSKTASEFFSNFLTESENIMLSKRFATLILLSRNKTPTEIHNSIHTTFSTIGSVSAWLKNAGPETQKILQKISLGKNWETIFDNIDNILDKLPPSRRSDWQVEYKEKNTRLNERLTRKHLR
jgi:uncharacterized protein YerC